MRLRALYIAALLLIATALSAHAGTPAGTVISNFAHAAYEGPAGRTYAVDSNTVTVTVSQVCGIEVAPDGTTAVPGQRLYTFFPSRTVSIPYTLRNTGNGNDAYSITVVNLSGDDADLSIYGLYIDSDQDGLYDTGEQAYDNLAPPLLSPGQIMSLVVAGDVTGPVFNGKIWVGIDGVSGRCASTSDTGNVSEVAVSTDGNVAASKSIVSLGRDYNPGGTVSFRIDYNAIGLNPVKGAAIAGCDFNGDGVMETQSGLLVSDPVPAYTAYQPGTVYGTPVNGFPVYAGADGIWKKTEAGVSGTVTAVGFFIPQDASGNALTASQYGYLLFDVAASPVPSAVTSSNAAVVTYANNGGTETLSTNTVFFNIVYMPDPVQVQVQVEVQAQGAVTSIPLDTRRVVVYEYDGSGNITGSGIFLTDSSGMVRFDAGGAPSPLYNFLRDGYTYRIGLPDELGGYTYNLSPEFTKGCFDTATVVGHTYPCGDVSVTVKPDGTKLLLAPLDPAGYVYDESTGAKIDGACVRFYRCDDPACSTYSQVPPSILDVYPDGFRPQENGQVSGPANTSGAVVGKGAGAFEFRFTSYDPILYDGYYFIEVDFACGLGASDPSLASVYSPVHPDRSAVWTPTSGQPYRGELFYINSLFPGAVLMRIPLAPASNLPLVVDKSVGVSVASMGDLVPFTVNVANPNASSTIYGVNAYDNLPRGLRYKPGSATLGGAPAEPAISPDGRLLSWTIGDMAAGARAEIRFLTYVVPEGGEGKRVNNANASGWQDAALTIPAGSNTADAGFAVNKGIFTDKAYIFGKVFIDENVNAVQDDNEEGVKGVKIYMEDGRYVVTGSEGKYHMDNVDPGSHVLKADETSLPAGTELTVVNNRNLGEPGSAFADVFPGDMFKANFRLARRPRDARAGAGTAGAVVRAGRTIDTIMSDPASGALTLKHGLVIKNNSDGPLYEVVYREASPYVPREGTVYMDGAPYSGVRAKDGAFALSFPLIEPGREVIFEFVSSLPDNNGAASGAITYGARPWGETTRRDVDAPVVFAGKGLDEYSIAVDFGGDGYSLSDDAKVSLDRISDALRKRDYRGITVSVNGHADEAAAADDPDLSYMRSKAVKDYLAGALLDMDRVTIGNEASDATGLDGSGAVARMPSGTPDAATYSDVPPDRGAGITIRPIVKGDSGGEMGPGGSLPAGKYRVTVSADMLSTLGRLYDAEAFLSLPEGMSYIGGTAKFGGEEAKLGRKGPFFVVSKDAVDGSKPLEITADFLLPAGGKGAGPGFVVFAKTVSGNVVEVLAVAPDEEVSRARAYYDGPGVASAVVAARKKSAYEIVEPKENAVQSTMQTDVRVTVPPGAEYTLTMNGQLAGTDNIGESAVDSGRNARTVSYFGLALEKGENHLVLSVGGNVVDEKTITVTGEVSGLEYSIYPEKPPADGKTPAYVVVETRDAAGSRVKQNVQLSVSVDKGDIYDNEAGSFKPGMDDGRKINTVSGKAVVKLSPCSETGTRTLTVEYGNISRDIEVRFYPERRPWIVAGALGASVGLNGKHGNPERTSGMPFDHSEGGSDSNFDGGVFAKGSVKDYTITLRYKEGTDENTLLKENVPSTEEGRFYPVYGDESEQYFEAQSKSGLFAKVEDGLSSILYGDYNTNFGEGLELNRYDRTLNGALMHLEEEDNFLLRGFVSRNSQSIVREAHEGRGMSGPYFLDNNPVIEFSDMVWIEVRDRFNNTIILDKVQLQRHSGYTINYDEGWIIFKEPVHEFDDSFNPVLIQVVYETDNLPAKNYMYGARAEKAFMGGKLRVGASSAVEENMIRDVRISGADMVAEYGGLKCVAELAATGNFNQSGLSPTSGSAGRVEAVYKTGGDLFRAYYKKVTDGFQNPSATNADTGYQTYGASGQLSVNGGDTVLGAEFVAEDRALGRKQASVFVDQKLARKLRANARVRWNRETSQATSLENVLGAAGLLYNPVEKLGITLGREQVLTGDATSDYYPTKTIGSITYALTKNLSAYVQSELQEHDDGDVFLTTAGLDAKVGENTTAFTKYAIDDSVSGWRDRAHLGVNHTFIVNDGLNFDAGVENVLTLSGHRDDSDDFTALRAGGTYLQSDRYKLTGKYEIRLGTAATDQLFNAGGSVRIGKSHTLLVTERYFDSAYAENDLLVGVAGRPVDNDRLNYFSMFRWKVRDDSLCTSRYIASLHANYQPGRRLGLMGECAAKYVTASGYGGSFTYLLRGRAIWDITDRLDAGVQAGILRHHQTGTQSLSYGPEVGFRLVKNVWLTAGYNFDGFNDRDFGDAEYWAGGPYFKVRVKFDEHMFGFIGINPVPGAHDSRDADDKVAMGGPSVNW